MASQSCCCLPAFQEHHHHFDGVVHCLCVSDSSECSGSACLVHTSFVWCAEACVEACRPNSHLTMVHTRRTLGLYILCVMNWACLSCCRLLCHAHATAPAVTTFWVIAQLLRPTTSWAPHSQPQPDSSFSRRRACMPWQLPCWQLAAAGVLHAPTSSSRAARPPMTQPTIAPTFAPPPLDLLLLLPLVLPLPAWAGVGASACSGAAVGGGTWLPCSSEGLGPSTGCPCIGMLDRSCLAARCVP
jgi:hypothetical protein